MIIESLLDTDIYKLSMMQAVLHQFPGAEVEYRFKCRTPDVDLRPLRQELERQIETLCSLKMDPEDLNFLASQRYFKRDFIEFLRLFHLQSRFIEIGEDNDQLAITIRGPWLHTILFEVPLLAIVSELYTRRSYPDASLDEARRRLDEKIEAGNEDILDFAAIQTFLNGATVFALSPERMPDGASLAAVFRY